jgi:hypothetical protein
MNGRANIKAGWSMSYSDTKFVYLKKGHVKIGAALTQVTLKDVPLEVRKKEARKPLFLRRYE